MATDEQLLSIPLFEELPPEELREVAARVEVRRAPKGAQVMSEDQPGGEVFFIVEGHVKVSIIGDEGRELIVTDMEGGDFFGEIAALTDSSRSANVVTLS